MNFNLFQLTGNVQKSILTISAWTESGIYIWFKTIPSPQQQKNDIFSPSRDMFFTPIAPFLSVFFLKIFCIYFTLLLAFLFSFPFPPLSSLFLYIFPLFLIPLFHISPRMLLIDFPYPHYHLFRPKNLVLNVGCTRLTNCNCGQPKVCDSLSPKLFFPKFFVPTARHSTKSETITLGTTKMFCHHLWKNKIFLTFFLHFSYIFLTFFLHFSYIFLTFFLHFSFIFLTFFLHFY